MDRHQFILFIFMYAFTKESKLWRKTYVHIYVLLVDNHCACNVGEGALAL